MGLTRRHGREQQQVLLASWLALCKLNRTGYGTSVKPAIGINAQGFTSILLELCGTVDGFKKRKKAF